VQRLWITRKEVSTARTIGLVAGLAVASVVAIAAIVLATKESCPFVYSWDGSRYVFDAEPYGGAISRGLEKDDYSELEHLVEQNGTYRLLLTNEVDETQFTNSVELWLVDHTPGVRVVAGEKGDLHGLSDAAMLSSAIDEDGNDLLPWLRSTDRLIWEPEAVSAPDGGFRDEIFLTFPRPAGASRTTLVISAATGLWGSYMIKRMVGLRGREAPAWLASMAAGSPDLEALHAWIVQQELYFLKIEVEEPGGWTVRGLIPGGGPFIAEDRAIPLDISRVSGERLRIRLRPPRGFWALNSLAAYYADRPVTVTRVPPTFAQTSDGADVLPDLLAGDDRYYSMPSTGDRAELRFQAPPVKPGTKRTIFLHSRGWYQLHLNTSGEPALDTIEKITQIPDGAARFAAEEFARWRTERR
jgi:hypothetical protein